MAKKDEGRVRIQRESPKTRSMDRTPNTLAKELGVSTNTIKNRLRNTGINFEMARSSEYQMYNYEGLPILYAYLGLDRFTEDSRNALAPFLLRLEKYLDDHPEQSFCRKFLYAQKPYQDYLLKAHLCDYIDKQLGYIMKLSRQLVLEANFSTNSPSGLNNDLAMFPDVLNRLNRIILELSNFTDLDNLTEVEKTQNLKYKHPKKDAGSSKSRDVDHLVKKWYTSIIGKRERLYKTSADRESIELEKTYGEEKSQAAALNERLLNETLFEEEDRIKQMESILKQIHVYQDDSKSIYGKNKKAVQVDIQKLMQYNIDIYWEKMLKEAAMPEFKLSEGTRLPWLIVDLVKEWFYEATKYAYDLQAYCCMKLQVVYRYEDQVIVERIKELWSIMKEAGYIPKIDKKGDVVASAIDACRIAAGSFRTQQNKERLIRLILNPPGSSLNHPLVVAAAAVTVEYFYQRHAAAYSQYYANLYMQYLTILDKLEKS